MLSSRSSSLSTIY